MPTPTSVLFVCLGNICRSPTAHAVMRARAKQTGVELTIDSAGTAAYHVGKAPDPRTQRAALDRGYPCDDLRARRVDDSDFERFDWILAMDEDNLADLQARCPDEHQHKVRLFLSFTDLSDPIVPDPYYGGQGGFEEVLDRVEAGVDALLTHLSRQ
ncbi:Protein-tyrosine-phosphatase [Saliniradius amylolyticus]|uniref:protein-tyrosine-phosphatase n=1 Tax=Saliniradius amylolyticus TaxID=2183582 RepID=A0A2S2E2D6_9ALTE|nr:low molecular weight protein-tyrosine-phosphatase [Saliniradius amylolyticus]AWL11816.1 Protein-tyrosine-phosphatase [Saliniradius amylolyticus]